MRRLKCPSWILCLFLVVLGEFGLSKAERLTKRRKTTSSTPLPNAEDSSQEVDSSVTSRELNLLKREEAFQQREFSFREREVNLTLREDKLKEREYKITVREGKVAEREKNVGKVGLGQATTTPKPDLHLERFDAASQKYFKIGSTEPCGENMRFFAVPDSDLGICDCDYHECSRPLIYSKDYNQCFWAWSQGPCEQNHWLTFNESLAPTCELNDCPKTLAHGIPRYYFKDHFDGVCYETATKAYCENEDERLLVIPEDPLPKCRTHSLCSPISEPSQQICMPGNRKTLEGHCPLISS